MHSIGAMARSSGLTVSALRFYDGAGVLVPALVDPGTGYRWYAEDQVHPARLLAGLRRVGMPLADISRLLAERSDPAAVRRLLDAHLRHLEDGLADARRELSRIHTLLDDEENPMTIPTTCTRLALAGADLARTIDAVRFAVSNDPELPALAGVLLEVEGAVLRLVATDRYRLAVSEAAARDTTGPDVSVVVRAAVVDEVRALLSADSNVTITLDGAGITVRTQQREVHGELLDEVFPDYRRVLRDGSDREHGRDGAARRVMVDVTSLRATLADGPTRSMVREQDDVRYDVAVLTVDRDGVLALAAGSGEADSGEADSARDGGDDDGERFRVGVNREFLLQALTAGGRGQLVLELDGPITPLAVRVPDDGRTFSLLMPTRLS